MEMEMLPFKNPLGRPLKYTPKEMVEKFTEYAQWCNDHPLQENSRTDYQKGFSDTTAYKPRRVSIEGFLVYIGCTWDWWQHLDDGKRKAEFFKVKASIREYCETYQKEMASAGLLNANIISRLLGLAEKQEVKQTGENVTIVVKSEEEKEKIEGLGELGV